MADAPDYGTAHYDADARFVDAQWRADDPGDIDFYVAAAETADDPVLELGCGTGRVYLPTLAAGVDIDGIDRSAGMLDVLGERAVEEGLEPSVWQADVTTFVASRDYSLVTFPFRGFLHLTDRGDQLAALHRIRESLAPGGRFVLNFFAPSFDLVCNHYGETQTTEVTLGGDDYRVETVSTLEDEVGMVARVEKRIRYADGSLVHESSFPIKLLPRTEFECLLDLAGFSNWAVHGGFDAVDGADIFDSDLGGDGTPGPDACELVWVVEP